MLFIEVYLIYKIALQVYNIVIQYLYIFDSIWSNCK